MAVITCPGCRERFTTAGNGARFQCPRCRRTIELRQWHVGRNKKKHGPFTWPQLQALARRGQLRRDDMLLPAGATRWQQASEFTDLFPAAVATTPARAQGRSRGWIGALVGAGVLIGLALVLVVALGSRGERAKEEVVAAATLAPDQEASVAPETPVPPRPESVDAPASPSVEVKPQAPLPIAKVADPVAEVLHHLNEQRLWAGAAAVTLDAELSRGCLAHARYLAQNPTEIAQEAVRSEDPARPGFSDEGRRAAEASIVAVSEPRTALARLLARLNSRVPLLNPELQSIGLGFAGSGASWICVFDLTRGRGEPVVVFPAPGQEDVPLTFSGGNEIPDPEASAGFPVTVTFPASARVSEAKASLKDDAGQAVDVWLSTPEAPARPRSQRNSIAMIAKEPLRSRCRYDVHVAAQVDGKTWSKGWRFTTEDDSDSTGAWARKALDRLNRYRAQAGQPPVALDGELSRGCLAHARYLARNAGHPSTLGLGAHDEDAKLPGFSEEGRTAGKAADIAIGDFEPLDGLEAWMATLYHRVPLLEPHLERIGFGCARGRRLGWIAVLDIASGRPRVPRPSPVFYPMPDQQDVPLHFPTGGEEPNPIPEDSDGKAGFPITATFPDRHLLRDATATLTGPAGSVTCWFSSPEKPANPMYPRHQGSTICLIPHDPLLPATTYRVSLKGMVDGQAWEKEWRFTTTAEALAQAEAAAQVVARLNEYRRRAGVGAVVYDPGLSRGCLAHAEYLVRNADLLVKAKASVNDEDPKLPGFTLLGQQTSRQSDVFSQAPTPVSQVDDLMATLFRRVYLLDPNLRRVGFGCAHDVGRGWRCVLDLIGGRGDQRVVVYPGSGQKEVPCAAADRLPGDAEREVGFPITVTFPAGAPIRNVQAVVSAADGVLLETIVSTPEMPLWPQAPRSTIAIYAGERLAPGLNHSVVVSAIVSGSEWRQSWSFTTAAK